MEKKLLFTPEQSEFIFTSYSKFEERLKQFLNTLPYSETNKYAWSPELVSLFLDICGLIDSISRQIIFVSNDKIKDGDGGKMVLVDNQGKIYNKEIYDLNRRDFESNLFDKFHIRAYWVVVYLYSKYPNCAIQPYSGYNSENGWWWVYNKLKHNRLGYYKKASLENVINSLASLFLILTIVENIDFSMGIVRSQWEHSGYVPDVVHNERFIKDSRFWYDSELFGTAHNRLAISHEDITKIETHWSGGAHSKFCKFIGYYNKN